MWTKYEKHTALALLFAIAAYPLTGFACALLTFCSALHLVQGVYHAFKE